MHIESPEAGENVPLRHEVHVDDPLSAYVPLEHDTQADDEAPPVLGW